MTRKDYKLIAEAIAATRKADTVTPNGALAYLIGYLGTSLRIDNPRFDYAKFAKASGLSPEAAQ